MPAALAEARYRPATPPQARHPRPPQRHGFQQQAAQRSGASQYPTLRPADTHEAVWTAQQRLVEWMKSRPDWQAKADFYYRNWDYLRQQGTPRYTPEMVEVVQAFQQAKKLNPDTIIGPLTWRKLRERQTPAPQRVVGPIHPLVRAKYLEIVNSVRDNYPATGRRPSQNVEKWRSLLVQYRWPHTVLNEALRVIEYECQGDQFQVSSTSDVGLFQINYRTWARVYQIRNMEQFKSVMWNTENNVMAALTIWKGNGQRFKGQWSVAASSHPKGRDIP